MQSAQAGSIWQAKSGKVTYFLRKINNEYEVWNSEYSTTHYKVTLDQAVVYANQYSMTNPNTNTKPVPATQPVSQAQTPSPKSTTNQSDDDKKQEVKESNQRVNLRTTPDESLQSTTRFKNPLGWLASYNYQFSLYAMDSVTYDLFVQSGRKSIQNLNQNSPSEKNSQTDRKGAYLIAQSGGRNIKEQEPEFPYDYGIDNIKIQTNGLSENGLSAVTYDISFEIIEPYGFSFISNLKRANDSLKGPDNPTKQLFVLGLRFYGYDQAGNLVKGSDIPAGLSEPIDPSASDVALFEKYYDINLNTIKVTLNGKETRYSVSCSDVSSAAGYSVATGFVDSQASLKGSTVADWIKNLVDHLNKQAAATAKSNKSLPYTYDITWSDEEVKRKIFDAKIVSPADLDQYKWTDSGAKNTKEVNDAQSTKNSKPKNTERTHTIQANTSILRAIDEIISQSSFMEDALSIVYDTALEPNSEKEDLSSIQKNPEGKTFEWFSCQPEVSGHVWDTKTNKWVFKTTYYIKLYKAPIIDTAYALPRSNYYGPFKRYEYWYTGKNSEILKYNHTLDNLYQNVVLSDSQNGDSSSASSTPSAPGKKSNLSSEGRQGNSLETSNAIKTYLYDPASVAEANITILGDPDYLGMPPSKKAGSSGDLSQDQSLGTSAVYRKFYDNDNVLDFGSGQVFIEIDFKEAVDYDKTGGIPGVLDINDSIQFWGPSETEVRKKANAKGLRYMVNTITSSFRQGKFQQDIVANLKPYQEDAQDAKTTKEAEREKSTPSPSSSGPAPGNSSSTTTNTGLTPDKIDAAWKSYVANPTQFNRNYVTPTGPGNSPVQSES